MYFSKENGIFDAELLFSSLVSSELDVKWIQLVIISTGIKCHVLVTLKYVEMYYLINSKFLLRNIKLHLIIV
jgi:hypothetical protein